MDKLSADELATAEVIGKLSADELAGAERVGKYPGPKSYTDEELGIGGGPVSRGGTKIGGAFFPEPEWRGYQRAAGAADLAHLKARERETADEFGAQVAGQVAGSAIVPVVGEGIGSAIGARGAKAVGGIAPNALSSFAKAGGKKTFQDVFNAAVRHASERIIGPEATEIGKDVVKAASARVGQAAKNAAVATLPPVANAVATAGGTVASGPMSNAIDRLRASAVGNPRAADLLARITQLQQPDFPPSPLAPAPEPSGTVTQGTLGDPNAH